MRLGQALLLLTHCPLRVLHRLFLGAGSSSLDDVVSQRALPGPLSHGKAKSTALRSLNKLKDMVAMLFYASSSGTPSHLPRPTVVAVMPLVLAPPEMTFLSLNVCGIRDANKRMSLMEWLSHHHVDTACSQETHAVFSVSLHLGFLAVSGIETPHALSSASFPYSIMGRIGWQDCHGRVYGWEFPVPCGVHLRTQQEP